jgi:lipid kinase YegS
MHIRVILNGKKAGWEPVRNAVHRVREKHRVEVRVTWEGGDARRLAAEAHAEGCRRVVAGGGDGTVKEVADALLRLPAAERPELAILPLGTANDFATACAIPTDPDAALALAASGPARPVDAARAGEHHFLNVASGGFGARLTATTPPALKNFLGGGAYTLTAVAQALKLVTYRGELRLPHEVVEGDILVGAACNGRQAGGGQVLAPEARIDDGLLDFVALHAFPVEAIGQVIKELLDARLNGQYVKRLRAPWGEWQSTEATPINLDGEPITARKIRFEALPRAIRLVLPEQCPLCGASA